MEALPVKSLSLNFHVFFTHLLFLGVDISGNEARTTIDQVKEEWR